MAHSSEGDPRGCAVQCKAYLAQPAELVTGLNLIHTTNLDYFTTQHQAEIFRLKGQFLQVRHTQWRLC